MDKNTRIVVSGLTAVIAAVISGLSAYLIPHIALVWQISAVLSVVALLTYVVSDISFFKALFAKKTARYGMNSILMAVIGLFIAIFVNMIANEYDLKLDVSKNKINTLSDESIKVLRGLEQDVTMRAFLQPNQVPAFEKIYDKYSYYSERLKKEYVDVDQDPLAVRRYNIKQPGTVIFESDTRTARVENLRGADDPKLEEKLTNAIIQVAKGQKKKIYFLKGHGERSVEDTGRDGYSQIKESLTAGRYDVADLVLLDKDSVPEDSDILIVAGPKSDFVAHELNVIEKYLIGGGKALIMLDPEGSASLQPLAAKFGANWQPKRAIFETNKLQQLAGGNPLAPIVTKYDAGHEITRENRELSIYPVVAPMEKAKQIPKGIRVTSLFSSSSRSMVAELKGNKLHVDQKKARRGPISLALAASGKLEDAKPKAEAKKDPKAEVAKKEDKKDEKKAEFRAIFVGDSDFAANGVGRFGINSDIFQNMLSWLAQEEDLISIRPKASDSSEFEITDARMRIIHVASVFILPLMMVISGIAVWITRRRR